MCVGGDVRQAQAPAGLIQHDVVNLRAQGGEELPVPRVTEHWQGGEVEHSAQVPDVPGRVPASRS